MSANRFPQRPLLLGLGLAAGFPGFAGAIDPIAPSAEGRPIAVREARSEERPRVVTVRITREDDAKLPRRVVIRPLQSKVPAIIRFKAQNRGPRVVPRPSYLLGPRGLPENRSPNPRIWDTWSVDLEDEDHGLGLTLRPVPEVLRAHLDLPEDGGLVVAEVAEGSPAEDLIEPNDILLRIGETAITDTESIKELIEDAEGETLSITLLRGGDEQTVEVPIPGAEDPESADERYVIGVRIDSPFDVVRSQLGMPEETGVIVMGVTPESPANEAGLEEFDILLEFGGEPIADPVNLAEQVQENGGMPVELLVLRDGEEITIEVTPKKMPAPPIEAPLSVEEQYFNFPGPGVLIDPETGGAIRRFMPRGGDFEDMPMFRGRNLMPIPPSGGPDPGAIEHQLDEILELLRSLREDVDAMKKTNPDDDGL